MIDEVSEFSRRYPHRREETIGLRRCKQKLQLILGALSLPDFWLSEDQKDHDKTIVVPAVAAFVWARRKSISARSLPGRPWAPGRKARVHGRYRLEFLRVDAREFKSSRTIPFTHRRTLFFQDQQDINVGGRQANSEIQLTLESEDTFELNDWAPIMLETLRTLPNLRDVSTDQQVAGLQATLVIDRATDDQRQCYGMDAAELLVSLWLVVSATAPQKARCQPLNLANTSRQPTASFKSL